MEAFDPYHEWLGIPPAEQPPHYYRLLGLPIFEADATRIKAEADMRMQHVRTFQLGKRSQDSQAILNELSSARVCLLNPQSKATYDVALSEWLAARLPVPPPVLPPEAPPLLPSKVRALPPADVKLLPPEEHAPAGSTARSNAAAAESWPAQMPRPRSYTGWIIILGVIAITAAGVFALRFGPRRERGTIGGATDGGPPPVALPAANQTSQSNLGGKTVLVPADVVVQADRGHVQLELAKAKVRGQTLKINGDTTSDWRSADDQIEWQFVIHKPGIFRVAVVYAAEGDSEGRNAMVTISGQEHPLKMSVRNTGGSEMFSADELSPMVMIKDPGRYTLTIAPARKPAGQLMKLRGVMLRQAPVGR